MSKFPQLDQFETIGPAGYVADTPNLAITKFDFSVPAARSERIISYNCLRQVPEHAFLPSVGQVENWLEVSLSMANVGIDWYDVVRLSICPSYDIGHDRFVVALRWFPHEGALCLEYREYANDNAPIGRLKIAEGIDGTKQFDVAMRLDANMQMTVLVDHPDLPGGQHSAVLFLNRNSYRNLRLAWSAGVHLYEGADSHGAGVATLTSLEVFHGVPEVGEPFVPAGADIKPEEVAPAKVRQQGSRKKK